MRRAPLALAAALSVLALGELALAYCRSTTSRERASAVGECVRSGLPLGWRSRCTGYSLYRTGVPSDIPVAQLNQLTLNSVNAWARVPCDQDGLGMQYFRVLPNLPTFNLSGYDPRGQNSNTISFRHRWNDNAIHRTGAIAITIATFDSFTGEIYDADMELNTLDEATNREGFHFSIGERVSDPGSADLQTILTHEFGHFMGLSHSDNMRAVMWPEAGLGEIRRDLSADDSAGMCAVYPEANTPQARCVSVPYGGLATQAGGTRVIGESCSATPGPGSSGAGLVALGLVGALALRRRERRVTPAS